MKRVLLFACLIFAIASGAHAQKAIYTNPQFGSIAKDHKIIGILPFKAIIRLRPNQMERLSEQQYRDMLLQEGRAVQSALHSYFLQRKNQHDFIVEFQDITTTNAILANNGVYDDNIDTFTPQELAGMLGVDAVIGGFLFADKPISDGAAVASMALTALTGFGYAGPTNSGKCTININDGNQGTLLWKYEKELSRGLGSDTSTIITSLMRKASRKFPYNKLKNS